MIDLRKNFGDGETIPPSHTHLLRPFLMHFRLLSLWICGASTPSSIHQQYVPAKFNSRFHHSCVVSSYWCFHYDHRPFIRHATWLLPPPYFVMHFPVYSKLQVALFHVASLLNRLSHSPPCGSSLPNSWLPRLPFHGSHPPFHLRLLLFSQEKRPKPRPMEIDERFP